MKRIVSLILLIMLLLEVNVAYAAETVYISTAEELAEFRNSINSGTQKHGILTKDIDLSEVCGNDTSWVPIGDAAGNQFNAYFNGNGHTISNLYINSGEKGFYGLFGYVSGGATIENLTITGTIIAPSAGAIAYQSNGQIKNCTNHVNITANTVGGICAYSYVGKVSGCKNYGELTSTGGTIGGIVSSGSCGITNCINYGTIIGQQASVSGGIIGQFATGSGITPGTVENNINNASVYGKNNTGGVAGICDTHILRCYNLGDISSDGHYVGGIVGNAKAEISDCFNSGNVKGINISGGIAGNSTASICNAKNQGNIIGSDTVGGICGNTYGTVKMAHNDASVAGTIRIGGIVGLMSSGSTLEKCKNTGDIKAETARAAGIAAETTSTDNVINEVCNYGKISNGGNFTAGIVSVLQKGTINDAYNVGIISASNVRAGIVAYNEGEISRCFNYFSGNDAEANKVCSLGNGSISDCFTYKDFENENVYETLYAGNQSWIAGEEYPEIEYFVNNNIKNEQELRNAVESKETPIELACDISLTDDLCIDYDVTIIGNFNKLMGNVNFKNASCTLENLITDGNKGFDSCEVTINGLVAEASENSAIRKSTAVNYNGLISVIINSKQEYFLNNLIDAVEMEIGDYIEMGSMYDEPIVWRCVDKDDNGVLLFSDKIVTVRCFDAREYEAANAERRENGSNRWSTSNLRAWLNSDSDNVEWYCDNPPTEENVWHGSEVDADGNTIMRGYNAYDSAPGFLTRFSTEEKNAIHAVTQKSILNSSVDGDAVTNGTREFEFDAETNLTEADCNYADGYGEYAEDKVFIPDISQVYSMAQKLDILGEKFFYGALTSTVRAHSEYQAESAFTWTRTPYTLKDSGGATACINWQGTKLSPAKPYSGRVGVRPMMYITNSTVMEGTGEQSTPYRVKKAAVEIPKSQMYYTLDTVSVQTPNGETAESPLSGSAILEIQLTKIAERNENDCIVYALYGEGKLEQCSYIGIHIAENQKCTLRIPIKAENVHYVKIFVWDSFTNMIPLSEQNIYILL